MDESFTGSGGSGDGGLGSDGSSYFEGIEPISITDEMKRSYLDYAMSVIVSRALPDVRDGLKPVHRRILYAMHEMGLESSKSYRKSAGVVGEVMGKYHPHGDSSIYDALVRMAQDFAMRVPLVDGQGNFGSIDGDKPAAMRYTECRLEALSAEMLSDIDRDTVDFQANYDGREQEPMVLPSRFPNLLVNGAGGIAVGMATNIPPHNPAEVIDGCLAILENPDIDLETLMTHIPGPDFPTGGLILGRSGIISAYSKGKGSIVMQAATSIETSGESESIIITEIPYQVNKSALVEKIADLVREKRVEGIRDIRDESDRQGYRVVVELKRDADSNVILNQLYRFTPLRTSFGANFVALDGGRPRQMNLHELLQSFVSFREEVVTRRTKFLLTKARDRAHILVGLALAVANIDKVIDLIRKAPDPATAREQLMKKSWNAKSVKSLILLIDDPRHKLNTNGTCNFSNEQARAILDLRLQRLTALGRDEIADELNTIGKEIEEYLSILASREKLQGLVKSELLSVRESMSSERCTHIDENENADMEDEDLIAQEEMVVTFSHTGYIKRVPLDTYRAQNRGGKGRTAMKTKDEDFVTRVFVLNTHTSVLFFSSRGIVYKLKVWKLPLSSPQARGKALVNLLPLQPDERITTVLPLPNDSSSIDSKDIMFATTSGSVRRNKLSDFVNVHRGGKIAMKLPDNDDIAGVEICDEQSDVLLISSSGQAIRFPCTNVRVFNSRASRGVRGINLAKGARVISMTIMRHFEADTDERLAYLKMASKRRSENADEDDESDESATKDLVLSESRFDEMSAAEEFILTVTQKGFGKRSSSYDFRLSNRGGKGIKATATARMDVIGHLVSAFPVIDGDQIMLVAQSGQMIRVPIDNIRFASRASKGVTIFKTGDEDQVVCVERISDVGEDNDTTTN